MSTGWKFEVIHKTLQEEENQLSVCMLCDIAGKSEVEEKGIVKLSNRLGSKKMDIFQNFLTIDNNPLLSVN